METGRRPGFPSVLSMSLLAPTGVVVDVVLVRWPSERGERDRLAAEGIPRLLLVEAGAAPPDGWAPDEDWIRTPADPQDLHHRIAALRRVTARPEPVQLDEGGLLWRGHRWVALAPVEQSLVARLLEHPGRLVPRRELMRAVWPEQDVEERAVDRGIARLRRKLDHVGVSIHAVHGCGYLLELGVGEGPRA